jgi:hypothetical protein
MVAGGCCASHAHGAGSSRLSCVVGAARSAAASTWRAAAAAGAAAAHERPRHGLTLCGGRLCSGVVEKAGKSSVQGRRVVVCRSCRVVMVAARRRKSCASMSRSQPGGVWALYSLPLWGKCTSGGAWERRARERPEVRGERCGAWCDVVPAKGSAVRYYLEVVEGAASLSSLSLSLPPPLSPQYAPKPSVAVDAIAALLLI